MSTEARQLLEMAGPRSAQDPGYASGCVAKWAPMLESVDENDPIKVPYLKNVTAILMENQAEHMLSLQEDTLSSNTGYFTKYVFPTLRRVWPNLIANQIVSVQPMTSPVSGIFYYENRYTDRKGTKIPQGGIADNPTDMGYDGELTAGSNIKQDFGKYYSSEFVDYDSVCTDVGTSTASLTQAGTNCRVTEWSPIRDNATEGQRSYTVKAFYKTVDNAGTGEVAITATMDASGNLVDNQATPKTVGTFDITTGNWSITGYDETGVASNFVDRGVIYFQYYINFELIHQTSGAKVPSIDLSITLYEVRAVPHKMKAQWSSESVEDMRALHGMDVEQELVSTFANEMMLEIDRGIISELIAGAAHAATWTYSATVPGEVESIRSVLTKINAVSAAIQRTSGRAPANFLVMGPSMVALIDQLSTHGDYASIEQNVQPASYGPSMADYGISRVGTLLRKYAVYCDPYMDETKILVGLKGRSFLDAGFVYAPYVPFQMTQTFHNPADFMHSKGVWTRHATKLLRGEYYGVITVSGLPSVTTTL